MGKSLFREASMERLSSPEQLDELISVTSTKAWFALAAIGCILVSALVWGFLGSIPTKIEGHGILINNGGIYTIQHHTAGQVIDVRFKPGDMVRKGDVVARIEAPELVDRINSLQDTIFDMENNQQSDSAEYKKLKRQVIQLREELDYKSQIVSQIDGRVLDTKISSGSIIQPGEPLISLEQSGGTVKMEAVVYVPAEQGGKILSGMEVQISPTTVNKEEYGFMLGRVIAVSKYPSTTESMMQTLGNENLVSMLAGQSAPIMVRIDLIPDSDTESGYKWSTPSGPPISIQSGMIIQGSVIISRERPIGKVIPVLKSTVH